MVFDKYKKVCKVCYGPSNP